MFEGAKSLRDPVVSQVLGEWVASSPLAKAPRYEATKVAQRPLIRKKQIEAVKQYAFALFPASEMIRLLMDLNVPKGQLPACVRVHDPPGGRAHHRNGRPISRPIPSCDRFMDTLKELWKPLALD